MSRKLMAVLFSSVLVLGNVSTSAWSASGTPAAQAQAVQTADSAKNLAPLPAGGAAGIKEAQGFESNPWVGLGLVAVIVVVAWVLIDNNDNDDSSSGTN